MFINNNSVYFSDNDLIKLTLHLATWDLDIHHSINRQNSVRARIMLFHCLHARHPIPIKKICKNNLMEI